MEGIVPMSTSLPLIVDRLNSLKLLHVEAFEFSNSLKALASEQAKTSEAIAQAETVFQQVISFEI